jgi:2-iminobutanoate/2-iminopropanoate deaminase
MKTIHSKDAPAAIGPYSQAVVAGGMVYVSGQIPFDPATGNLVSGTIAEETDRALRNVAAILGEAGSSMQRVVRTTVYLSDMADFAEMNGVYARHMGDHRPARATVQVAGLPRGARVEIDAIALAGRD